MSSCVGCDGRAVQQHHAVYAQHIRRYDGDTKDPRALVPVCVICHTRHHQHVLQLELRFLPDAVFEFAAELMGGPAAFEYLGRYYRGEDPRRDRLLGGAE